MKTEEPLAAVEPRSGRGKFVLAAILVCVLLLAIFVPPLVSLRKYRRSVSASLSGALGRPVAIGSMQLRLLPTPGITMSGFTVAEDPAFGYEPVLHANSVIASLRFASLWRGRLEVSRISLDEVSLNLVKNAAGQWNIESVLTRASQVPNEPTGNARPGPNPRFPYIEASDARINFKDGVEKRPFSLLNAEFAMWQANQDEWRIRLKAQPVRTDLQLHLSDTGQLTLEGSLRRAASLDAMPVNVHAVWSGAQMGQVTMLLAGMDAGWRGDVDIVATAGGTVSDLALTTQLQIGNLRRQEFQPANPLAVTATCRSQYERAQKTFRDISCFVPAGGGHLLLTGSAQGFSNTQLDLRLEVNQTPAELPVSLLALLRPSVGNVSATGRINGSFHLVRGPEPLFTGDAGTGGLTVTYSGSTVTLPRLHFVAQGGAAPEIKGKRKRAKANPPAAPAQPFSLALEKFPFPAGEPQPLNISGDFSRSGFLLRLNGAAAVDRLMSAGHVFGFSRGTFAVAKGKARAELNTTIAGGWITPLSGSGPGLITTGTVRVTALDLRAPFLRAPLEVVSADINLTPDEIAWQNATFRYSGLNLHGSAAFPANCGQTAPCSATVSLDAADLNGAALEGAIHRTGTGLFGNIFSGSPPAWPPVQGDIQIGTLALGRLLLHKVSANVSVEGAALSIRSCDAAGLGGTVHATGDMSVVDGTPHWNLDLRFTGIKAGDAGSLFEEQWGSGTANGELHLKTNGYTTADLVSSAAGEFQMTWLNGGLLGVDPPMPLARFGRWTAAGTVQQQTITLTSGGIGANRGPIVDPVTGTIRFNRQLNLSVHTKNGSLRVSGTLSHPVAEQ
ncbi:MAG TPA: AsmA family protein [Acidobacteriaceae bacterium]|nr:AsmA family protein [Acidobacteriaceae bacterium]